MLVESIRRTMSALLMTSILSSSLSPAFAMYNGNNDEDDGVAPVFTQSKQIVSNAVVVSQETPATSSSTTATSTSLHTFAPLFALDPQMSPFWASLYGALSPLDRSSLEGTSHRSQDARRVFERVQLERVRLCDLYRNPSLAKRFGRLIVDDITHCEDEKNIVDSEGEVIRIPNFLDASWKIGVGDESKLNLSQLGYLDATVKDPDALSAVLKNVRQKAAVHLSLNDSITGDVLEKLKKIFPFEYTSSTSSDTFKKISSSPLMRLNSLRVIVDSAQTALSFLTWWSSHLRMGDESIRSQRPHLQMFINQTTRDYTFVGELSDEQIEVVEEQGLGDPRQILSELTGSERDGLQAFETDFRDFGNFLRPYHEAENEGDILGNYLFNESLLRIFSHSDFLDGVDFNSMASVGGEGISSSMINNLAFVKRFFDVGDSFARRKHMEEDCTVQPTTFLEVLTVAEPLMESLDEGEDKAIVFGSLARLPRYYRKSAVKSLLNHNVEDGQEMGAILDCLSYFNKEDHDQVTGLLSNLLKSGQESFPDSFDSSSTTEPVVMDSEDESQESFPGSFDPAIVENLDPLLKSIPRGQRLGALKSAVSFMTSRWVDLKSITSDESAAVLQAYGSLATDDARAEFDEFLEVNLPLNPDANVYEYMSIAAAIPADQRTEVTPLVTQLIPSVSKIKNDSFDDDDSSDEESHEAAPSCGNVSNLFTLAKLIVNQNPAVRTEFCQKIKPILEGMVKSEDLRDSLRALSAVSVDDQVDVLEKTETWCGGFYYLVNDNIAKDIIRVLGSHSTTVRNEIFSLISGFVATRHNRVSILNDFHKMRLQLVEMKELAQFLSPAGVSVYNWTDEGKSGAIYAMRDLPRNYRLLFIEVTGVRRNPENYNWLKEAGNFYNASKVHLSRYSFEKQREIILHLKGNIECVNGKIFAAFGTLIPDEDPIEIAQCIGMIPRVSIEEVIKLPKGQRRSLALEIATLLQQITHTRIWPIDGDDIIVGLEGANPARIRSLLKQAMLVMRGHTMSGYDVKEILKQLVALPVDVDGEEVAEAISLLCLGEMLTPPQMDAYLKSVVTLPKGQRISLTKDIRTFVTLAILKTGNQYLTDTQVIRSLTGIDPQDLPGLLCSIAVSASGLSFNLDSMPHLFKGFAKTRSLEEREDLVKAELLMSKNPIRSSNHAGFEALLLAPVGSRAICAQHVLAMVEAAQINPKTNNDCLETCNELYALLCNVKDEDWNRVVQSVNAVSATKLQECQKRDPVFALNEAIRRLKLEEHHPTK